MNTNHANSRTISVFHFALPLLVLSSVVMVFALIQGLLADGILFWYSKWRFLIVGLAGTALILLVLFYVPKYRRRALLFLEEQCRFLTNRFFRVGSLLVLAGAILGSAYWFTFSPYADLHVSLMFSVRLSIFASMAGWILLMAKIVWRWLDSRLILMITILGQSVVWKVASLLTRVSSMPFVLTWEENYRLYYASLLASERLYGVKLPLSPVDFSLNLLNSVPFLVGDFPIWAHRLWYVLLTIGITLLTAWSLARRLKLADRLWNIALIGFLWLFLLQEGGVKYNLQLAALLILLAVSAHSPWRSLPWIVLASFWAGLSRVNWLPVPAMIAIGIYLLEEPIGQARLVRYVRTPVFWGLAGIAGALVGQWLISTLPDASHSSLSSILEQDLLWYRLLPNATYAPGILIPLLIISVPLWYFSLRAMASIHWIRKTGLVAMMLILLAEGIVASVKIGGGSDLHNLDAYFVLIMVVASYAFLGQLSPEAGTFIKRCPRCSSWMLVLLFIVPISSACMSVKPYVVPDERSIASALEQLQSEIDRVPAGQEVLVMYQRPLVTFGYLKVKLVPEYENVLILDMAMSGDEAYLRQFYNDLCLHRFGLILAEYQPGMLKGRQYSFGEENDIWYIYITQSLLRAYEPLERIEEAGIELYRPRADIICSP